MPSVQQKAALAVDVEAYEADAAKERMSTGGKGVEKIPPVHKGKARAQIYLIKILIK